jgi:DNA-binding transcriptional ArsR family regulator
MSHSPGGWSLVQSIAAELDVALGAISGAQTGLAVARLTQESVPADWQAAWSELMGRPRPWPGVLGTLASLAAVEDESDYSKATLAMRELTLAEALERAAAHYAPYGLAPDLTLEPAQRLVALMAQGVRALEAQVGLQRARPAEAGQATAYEVTRAVRVLRDGDLHARFWHWLDRGYYEWYRPWRESQASLLAAETERAVRGLGAPAGEGAPPIDWLPEQHPLRFAPELRRVVEELGFRVRFWVQPFGLFDSWALGREEILVSFAEPGQTFSDFRERAADLARRANALSDPTRLMILRLIRNYAKDNTQMAQFLGVARPAVSTHAKILREAGLIETAQEGRAARHTIDYGAIRRLFADLAQFLDLPAEE